MASNVTARFGPDEPIEKRKAQPKINLQRWFRAGDAPAADSDPVETLLDSYLQAHDSADPIMRSGTQDRAP